MDGLQIQRLTSKTSDPVAFEHLATVYRALEAEFSPDDPPSPDRIIESARFTVPSDQRGLTYLATVDGEPAGAAWARSQSAPDDEIQVAYAYITVRAEVRRRGVATALAEQLIPALVELGQNSVLTFCCREVSQEASQALCYKFGLTERGAERHSRVDVAAIDQALMDDWIEDADRSAPGYRLEQWVGVCPDHLVQQWTVAKVAMEDEPTDDLDYNPHTRSPELQHEADGLKVADGYRIHRTLCLSPQGHAAGLTELYVHEDLPQLAYQSDTGVVAAHRGRRIGRWLKAANLRYVMDHHPELLTIETSNAESNPWMLSINVAMGFEPHLTFLWYQGPI